MTDAEKRKERQNQAPQPKSRSMTTPYSPYRADGPEARAGRKLVDGVFPSPQEQWDEKRRNSQGHKNYMAGTRTRGAAAAAPREFQAPMYGQGQSNMAAPAQRTMTSEEPQASGAYQLGQVAKPAIKKAAGLAESGARGVAGAGTLVPRAIGRVANNIYRGFTGQPENPEAFRVFPFNNRDGEAAAGTSSSGTAQAQELPAAIGPEMMPSHSRKDIFPVAPAGEQGPAQPSATPLPGAAVPGSAVPGAAGQSRPPAMQFSNKQDQDNYRQFGLKEMTRDPNPSQQNTLLQGDDGRQMIRETMNGGQGAPGPVSGQYTGNFVSGPLGGQATPEQLKAASEASAVNEQRRMEGWQGRNKQWAAQEGEVPLQQSQTVLAEASARNADASAVDTQASTRGRNFDLSQAQLVGRLQAQLGAATDGAERARITQQLQAYGILTDKAVQPKIEKRDIYEDGLKIGEEFVTFDSQGRVVPVTEAGAIDLPKELPKRITGKVYMTAQGPALWDGKGLILQDE